jgi:hypothetical protein
LGAFVDGGRLATITGAPPPEGQGVNVADLHVRADGDKLCMMVAASLAVGKLHVDRRFLSALKSCGGTRIRHHGGRRRRGARTMSVAARVTEPKR